MTGRVWQASVMVAVLGFVGCASGNGTIPTIPLPTASSGPDALVGPDWTLTSLAGKPKVEGTTLTATFSQDDRVSGSAGCNRYFGGARGEGGSLSVSPLASTMMACGQDGVMEQEQLYLALLQGATRYSIQGSELRLGPGADHVTLVFAAR
jgi:heat shock protein HslJ